MLWCYPFPFSLNYNIRAQNYSSIDIKPDQLRNKFHDKQNLFFARNTSNEFKIPA